VCRKTGSTITKGLEVLVTGVPISKPKISLGSLHFHLSKVKNRITKLLILNNPIPVNLGQKQSDARKCGDSIRSRREAGPQDQSLMIMLTTLIGSIKVI